MAFFARLVEYVIGIIIAMVSVGLVAIMFVAILNYISYGLELLGIISSNPVTHTWNGILEHVFRRHPKQPASRRLSQYMDAYFPDMVTAEDVKTLVRLWKDHQYEQRMKE